MITLSDVKIIEKDIEKVRTANATLSCPCVNRFPAALKVVEAYPLFSTLKKVQIPFDDTWIQWELF